MPAGQILIKCYWCVPYFVSSFCIFKIFFCIHSITQPAHDLRTTLYGRFMDVGMLKWRHNNVFFDVVFRLGIEWFHLRSLPELHEKEQALKFGVHWLPIWQLLKLHRWRNGHTENKKRITYIPTSSTYETCGNLGYFRTIIFHVIYEFQSIWQQV